MATELIDSNHTHRDTKLLMTAIRKKWAIPENVYNELPEMALAIAREADKPSDRNNAMKLLMAMKKDNEVDPSQPRTPTINVGVNIDNGSDENRARLAAIAQRLGVDDVPGITDSRPAT